MKNENLLVGDAARQAFNTEVKTACIYCDMFDNFGVTDVPCECCETAEKIDRNFQELYVVARDYSWTYIKTHENDGCGPYFFKK